MRAVWCGVTLAVVCALVTAESADWGTLMKRAKRQFEAKSLAAAEATVRTALAGLRYSERDEQRRAKSSEALASILSAQEKFREAIEYYETALRIREKQARRRYDIEAKLLDRIAKSHRVCGVLDKALIRARQAVNRAQRAEHDRALILARCRAELGLVLGDLEQYADAEKELSVALPQLRSLLPRQHPVIAASLFGLGYVYFGQGRFAEARDMFKASSSMGKVLTGPLSAGARASELGLARVSIATGDLSDATSRLRRILAHKGLAGSQNHVDSPARVELAGLLLDSGRTDGVADLLKNSSGDSPGKLAMREGQLALLDCQREMAMRSIRAAEGKLSGRSDRLAKLWTIVAESELLAGRPKAAMESLQKISKMSPDPKDPFQAFGILPLVLQSRSLLESGKADLALVRASEALALCERQKVSHPVVLAQVHLALGEALRHSRRPEEAAKEYGLARNHADRTGVVIPKIHGPCYSGLAEIERTAGRTDKAVALYRASLNAYKGAANALQADVRETRKRLADALEASGDRDGAKRLRDHE